MESKDITTIAHLNEERSKLIAEMGFKQDKINEITKQIREINFRQYQHKLEEMGIDNGVIFVGFAKKCDYHYDMIKVIQVKYVSKTSASSISCIVSTYRADDYYYSFHVSQRSSTLCDLVDFFNDNTVYSVNHNDYIFLLKHMVELSISHENVNNMLNEVDSWDGSKKMTEG